MDEDAWDPVWEGFYTTRSWIVPTAPTDARWTDVELRSYRACALDVEGDPTCFPSFRDWVSRIPGEETAWLDGPFRTLSLGGSSNACGVRLDGSIECRWSAGDAYRPPEIREGEYLDVDVSDAHSCALDTAGELHCWMNDTSDEGDPDWTPVLTPPCARGKDKGGDE
jgi:hypothetical protein